MTTPKFEPENETSPHHLLNKLAGEWEGMTKTWFESDQLADESPMRGSMKPILGGRFILHEYKGSMQGKPFEGVAIYGCALGENNFQSAWVDSFHMGTAIMFSQGKNNIENFDILGGYSYGDQRWGWRTTIETEGDDKVIITAYNITPEGQEGKAVETLYYRKK